MNDTTSAYAGVNLEKVMVLIQYKLSIYLRGEKCKKGFLDFVYIINAFLCSKYDVPENFS